LIVAGDLKQMASKLFREERMGLDRDMWAALGEG